MKNIESLRTLTLALVLPGILFSSYLFNSSAHLNFFGDVAILYFPQFVEGYHMARQGALVGIDFLTGNGASAYFLRPNLPVYYPPYQLAYKLWNFGSIESLARAFVIIMYLHSVLAFGFCLTIARRFILASFYPSLFLAISYVGAISYYAFIEPPFFYAAALFPCLVWVALSSAERFSWWRTLFFSVPYLITFLGGYLPLDANAIALAVVFSTVFVFGTGSHRDVSALARIVFRVFAPVAVAAVIVLPLFLSMMAYHDFVTRLPAGVWSAAHQFSFEPQDVLASISRGFVTTNTSSGAPFVRVGFIPIILLLFVFSRRKLLSFSPKEIFLVSFAIATFLFYFFLSFGPLSGLADIFYFLVPVLGKMHFYGRYLMPATFFLFLAATICFQKISQEEHISADFWIKLIGVLAFVVIAIDRTTNIAWINSKVLAIELIMTVFVLVTLVSGKRSVFSFVVVTVVFLTGAANFNSHINYFGPSVVAPYRNDVAFSPERRESFVRYLRENSTKTLIKYADLTGGIEKSAGLMLNFPWMIRDKIPVSNYMGYEPHLSLDRVYMERYPHPYYGEVNQDWVIRTGADYIVYDEASWSQNSVRFQTLIDQGVSVFDLGHGFKVAKLRLNLDTEFAAIDGQHKTFDNGIFNVWAESGIPAVEAFETNLVSRVKFTISHSKPSIVRYLLFPNKMMEIRINGKIAAGKLDHGMLVLDFPPGRHEVEYRYNSLMHRIFSILIRAYFYGLSVIVVFNLLTIIRGRYQRGKLWV